MSDNVLNNLAITATNSAINSGMGILFDTFQGKLANGGRDNNCKFYYDNGTGGSLIRVATKGVLYGTVSELKDEIFNSFNSSDKEKEGNIGRAWIESELVKKKEEENAYGKMEVDGGTIYALDDWGCISPDALMLGIQLDPSQKKIEVIQKYPKFSAKKDEKTGKYFETTSEAPENRVWTSTLVWYDTTALVTVNSDKNIILTRVQGRDYSRKELVSNGDIKFSVTGQITSGKPDIYPAEEIKKFIKIMQYKGIIKVNNQVLDQFGVENIIITDFSITPRQGYKAVQSYTFSAIGLQPEKNITIDKDTVTITPQKLVKSDDERSEWDKMFDEKLLGLKSMGTDIFSQSAGIAIGMLGNNL